MQDLADRHMQFFRRQEIHVAKRLGTSIRAGAQYKLKVIAEAKQFRLGIAVSDRHQRPFFRKLL